MRTPNVSWALRASLLTNPSFELLRRGGARGSPPSGKTIGPVAPGGRLCGGTGAPFSLCVVGGSTIPRG